MGAKKKNKKNKNKIKQHEMIEKKDNSVDMKDETKDNSVDMKDETQHEKDNPLLISNEEFMIFKNAYLFYSRNQINSNKTDANEKENLQYNTINEKQRTNLDSYSIDNNNAEPFGKIIDDKETDLNGNPILKKIDKDTLLYNGRIFKLYSGLTTETKETYRCQYYRKDEKILQETGQPKFCRSTIIYYFPSKENTEKYIFKNKHSPSCDILYAKTDIDINYAIEDLDKFVFEANELLNSKTYYNKSDYVNSLVNLNNIKKRTFPLQMNKIYAIMKQWKENSNKFTKFSILMFPYTHSLKDYLRVYNFKNVLNKKEEKMEQIEYAIWAIDDNIIRTRESRYWHIWMVLYIIR